MNAIITGVTKGIGRAVALAFAGAGMNVAGCARNREELDELGEELERTCPGIHFIGRACDCTRKDELMGFAGEVYSIFSTVEVLVNNVGTYAHGSVLEEPADTLQSMLSGNLMPAYHLGRYVGKRMCRQQTGAIFNIESVAVIHPVGEAASYSIAKAALHAFTSLLREALRPCQVKVTAVLPGSTYTASWEGTRLPRQDFVQPEDIARALLNALNMSPGAGVDEIRISPVKGNL